MQRGHTIDSSLKVIEAELFGKSERARATKVLSFLSWRRAWSECRLTLLVSRAVGEKESGLAGSTRAMVMWCSPTWNGHLTNSAKTSWKLCSSIGCWQHVVDRSAGSQEGSQHHVLRRSGRIQSSSWDRADLHSGPCRTQGKNWSTINVAMPEVRVGTRKGARAWQDHFVDIFEGVSGNLEAESEVPSNHSFERVRDRIGLARRRHLRDRTTRKHEQDVRRSRDQNFVEILTHHQRQNLVRACWNFEGHRRRKHVGKRTGQVRIVPCCRWWRWKIAVYRRVPSSRNRLTLETMIPVIIQTFTDQQCALFSTWRGAGQTCRPQRDRSAKVMETVGQKRSDTSKARKTWRLSCRGLARQTASRHTSMETGLATTLTRNLHLECIWWQVVVDCTATAGRLDNLRSVVEKAKSWARASCWKKAKLSHYNLEFCGMGLVPILSHTDADVARAFSHKSVCRMNHLDVRHCWLREELRNGELQSETSWSQVQREWHAHSQSLRRRTAEVPFHDWLSNNDSEERKLQCSQDDAEKDACTKDYSIPCEHEG